MLCVRHTCSDDCHTMQASRQLKILRKPSWLDTDHQLARVESEATEEHQPDLRSR